MVSLKEFYRMLDAHDWFWYMADDPRPYNEGESKDSNLAGIAQQSPEHKKLYNDFHDHIFSGPTWGNERKEKPAEPKEAI